VPSERPRRAILPNLRAILRHPLASPRRKAYRDSLVDRPEYEEWIDRYDRLEDHDRQSIAAHIARMEGPPRISVLMPVYDPPVVFLRAAIQSVLDQLYPSWELCIADDASSDPAVRALLAELRDPRIRVVGRQERGGIAAASNTALDLVRTEWVALLDHDDLLAPHALYMVAAEIDAHPDAAMIFSDEDALDEDGGRFRPFFKPDWNPELMLGQNAFSHLGVFRAADVRRAGGFRPGFDGSQDWDLVLRMADAVGAGRIRHIPHILYHWRLAARAGRPRQFSRRHATEAAAAAEESLRDHLAGNGVAASFVAHEGESWKQVLRAPPSPPPLVTVIVPAAGRNIRHVVDGLLGGTDYAPFEVLLVGSKEPAGIGAYPRDRVRLLTVSDGATAAVLANRAVEEARGEVVVLLDGGIIPSGPRWLAELVAQAARPEIGAAGGTVLSPRGRIRHGGLLLGIGGVAGPAHGGWRGEAAGYFGRARLAQDVSAVSGACLATRRSLYREVGGFDPLLAWHYGDVDYCLRLRRAGYRIIWTPLARLEQMAEGRQRASGDPAQERALMRARWADVLDNDPAGNPNLSLENGDFELAFPPRARKPWKAGAGVRGK
jgi:GT2 family glycosyltransferase